MHGIHAIMTNLLLIPIFFTTLGMDVIPFSIYRLLCYIILPQMYRQVLHRSYHQIPHQSDECSAAFTVVKVM